jgi:hypothetical protein
VIGEHVARTHDHCSEGPGKAWFKFKFKTWSRSRLGRVQDLVQVAAVNKAKWAFRWIAVFVIKL